MFELLKKKIITLRCLKENKESKKPRMSETTGGLVDKVLQNFFNDFFFHLVVFIEMYKK